MSLTVEPSGLLGLPLKHLRAMVAASETFQDATGAADATAALDFVSIGMADDTASGPPRAVIRWPEEVSIARVSRLGQNWSASILLTFEFPTDTDNAGRFEDAYTAFCNQVGEVIREILALTGRPGFLDITGIRIGPLGQAMIEENDGEDFFVCHTIVNFEGLP